MINHRIQNQLSDLLEVLIEAYYSPRKEKIPILKKVNVKIETLRHYFRLAFDLRFISIKKYEAISKELNEIGKMNGAWLKKLIALSRDIGQTNEG